MCSLRNWARNGPPRLALLFALVFILTPGVSQAITISFDDSFGLQTPANGTFSLPLFDSTLGTLLSATLELTGSMEGQITVQNTDATAGATVNSSLFAPLEIAAFGGIGPLLANPGMAFLNVLTAAGMAGDSAVNGIPLTNDMVSGSTSNPGDLAAFIGLGNFLVNYEGSAQSQASGGCCLLAGFNALQAGNLRVTYEYEPDQVPEVPEPMTLLLVGSGLLGAALLGRKKAAA